jgi:hypothetical protein
MLSHELTDGTLVRVTLTGCSDPKHEHDTDEEGMTGRITAIDDVYEHGVFVTLTGRPRDTLRGRGLSFRADELEPCEPPW